MIGFSKIKKLFYEIIYPIKLRHTAYICGENLYVGGKTSVTNKTILGDHVSFNGMEMSGNGEIKIGKYFHSGTGCQIITSFHNYEGDAIPYDETMIDKDVIIGDYVWLGNNVIVLGGVTIGEGAIIQAGSVVCKNIPAYSIAGGHPAEVFGHRNKEHFLEMKKQNKYH